jgi:hypothetical protein
MGEISSFDPYSTNAEKYHMVGDRGVIFGLWLNKWRSLFSETGGSLLSLSLKKYVLLSINRTC